MRVGLRRAIIHSRVRAYISTCRQWTVDSKSSRGKITANCDGEKSQKINCPKMNASGKALFDEDLGPSSTDNTHLSNRPQLEALPLLTYTQSKESFRGSEETYHQSLTGAFAKSTKKNIVENPYDTLPTFQHSWEIRNSATLLPSTKNPYMKMYYKISGFLNICFKRNRCRNFICFKIK